MVNKNGMCPMWRVDCVLSQPYDAPHIWRVQNSSRAGGDYEITHEARYEVDDLGDDAKARLTSILVEQWMKGIEMPRLTADDVQHAKSRSRLPMLDRAERVLRLLVNRSSYLGDILDFIDLNNGRYSALRLDTSGLDTSHFEYALAWSESINFEELGHITNYLAQRGLIQKGETIRNSQGYEVWHTDGLYSCVVEVAGYSLIEQSVTNLDSSQCFVAMWFDDKMLNARNEGIIPAIEDAGYKPLIIDQKPDLIGKIEDDIIAEIRRSKFMVADFTHGKDGVRGSVYYEAGFAHALGLKVIFTRQQSKEGVVHFDTDHFYRIEWETPEDLRKQLRIKIEAAIGEGPLKKSPPN